MGDDAMWRAMRMMTGSLLIALALTACAANRQDLSGSTDGKAPIGKDMTIALPSPADFGRPVEVSQVLTMTAHGRTIPLETRLSITRKSVSLVALDMMGRRAITLGWDGTTLTYEKADWVPAMVDPGAVLADVYLLYGSQKALNERLAPLDCLATDRSEAREVTCRGTMLLDAKFGWPRNGRWNGILNYANRSWGYEVEVQSTEMKQ